MLYLKSYRDGILLSDPSGLDKPGSGARKRRVSLSYRRRFSTMSGRTELAIDDRFANRLALDRPASVRMEVDDLLKANENAARFAFETTIKSFPIPQLSAQFSRNLGKFILPKLAQVGMDAGLALDLFRMGKSAWQLMGPYLHKSVAYHPQMLQEVRIIRDGLQKKAASVSDASIQPQIRDKKQQRELINKHMAPENLAGLLDQVPVPWIILPRTYKDLEKGQCRYLPIYLQFIDKDGSAESNRCLIRMAIGLLANYSAKYSDRRYSAVILKNAVFHAYEAMFWRNLRRPPVGFEDCRVFESFLNFLVRHACKWYPISPSMHRAILRMQTACSWIFPRLHPNKNLLAPACFRITLRHGVSDMQALLRYFENMPTLYRSANQRDLGSLALLKATAGLIKEVRNKCRHENHRTRQNMLQFFMGQRRLYAQKARTTSSFNPLDVNAFSALRVMAMIDGLNRELSREKGLF